MPTKFPTASGQAAAEPKIILSNQKSRHFLRIINISVIDLMCVSTLIRDLSIVPHLTGVWQKRCWFPYTNV